PHVKKDGDKVAQIDELVIDTGYSKEELSEIVSLGDRITVDNEPAVLLNNRICAPACGGGARTQDPPSCSEAPLRKAERLRRSAHPCLRNPGIQSIAHRCAHRCPAAAHTAHKAERR
ncbi:MAG: hypothetical protein IKK82_14105, partial [Kiritimatiellae bacterium]|nr:hypothetical protein [Kiritimatiellia bacterium]